MEDCIVALVFLDAHSRGLLQQTPSLANYQSILNNNDLYDEYWLLIYEANIKGWLSSTHIQNDLMFSYLAQNGVSFYAQSNRLAIRNFRSSPSQLRSFSGGGY